MSGEFRRPRDVAVVDGPDPTLYLAHMPDGPILVLEGTASVIWRAAVAEGEEAWAGTNAVVERVAEETGIAPEGIREVVVAFLADLVARGLLEPTN